jgi:group II intron reverse transcriptase/maturase
MAAHSAGREPQLTGLDRIGWRATAHPETVFNNLGYAVTVELLLEAYQRLDRSKAVGVDKVTKEMYGENLDYNISELLKKIRKGTYRPQPVRIVEIPKEDGNTRPLAISCLEDKLVQWAVAEILGMIYEPVFLPCSYGFRPNRNCHDALRSLTRVSYAFSDGGMVEIDIRKCFNMIPHEPLMLFIKEKITDSRFLKLINTLITVPVLQDGQKFATMRGCPQGSILSPILANIYLHHVVDLWFKESNATYLKGKAELIRYADDMVFVFDNLEDAKRVWQVLDKRLKKYGLELHSEKSRLLESGSKVAKRTELSGKRMPTFQFLGFTCYWGKARKGFWRLKYTSRRDRFAKALKNMREHLRCNLNTPDIDKTLKGVVQRVKGWVNYHAISDNHKRVNSFLYEIRRIVYKWFNRKGSKRSLDWKYLPYWLERVNFPKTYKSQSMFPQRKPTVAA